MIYLVFNPVVQGWGTSSLTKSLIPPVEIRPLKLRCHEIDNAECSIEVVMFKLFQNIQNVTL